MTTVSFNSRATSTLITLSAYGVGHDRPDIFGADHSRPRADARQLQQVVRVACSCC
jgi:hypothetical protein